MISAKKYRQVTRRSSNFLSLTFDFRQAMLCKNLVRYFLLRRYVFIYTTTPFSHKRKTYTKKFDFFTFWSGRSAWFYLFRWAIWSFHLIGNHQKLSETGRHGELFCFFSKQKQSLNTVSIKTSLCSIYDTAVFRNNIEVITYSYGRGNTSVYFWSPYFFSLDSFFQLHRNVRV